MSPKTVLNIGEFFGLQGIATRDAARTLIAEISRSEQPVVLDFRAIVSVSRSFIDELNAFLTSTKQKVQLLNLNDDLEQMLAIVRKTARRKSRVTYDSLADAELLTL